MIPPTPKHLSIPERRIRIEAIQKISFASIIEKDKAELADARHEASCCDDIKLNQPLAGVISDLQADREFLRAELKKAKAEQRTEAPHQNEGEAS